MRAKAISESVKEVLRIAGTCGWVLAAFACWFVQIPCFFVTLAFLVTAYVSRYGFKEPGE